MTRQRLAVLAVAVALAIGFMAILGATNSPRPP
jgi:hypothetical protein